MLLLAIETAGKLTCKPPLPFLLRAYQSWTSEWQLESPPLSKYHKDIWLESGDEPEKNRCVYQLVTNRSAERRRRRLGRRTTSRDTIQLLGESSRVELRRRRFYFIFVSQERLVSISHIFSPAHSFVRSFVRPPAWKIVRVQPFSPLLSVSRVFRLDIFSKYSSISLQDW